jgi:hypothetical protein
MCTSKTSYYIHQWEYTEFLMDNPHIFVKDMKSITSGFTSVPQCDCCSAGWNKNDIIIKILT